LFEGLKNKKALSNPPIGGLQGFALLSTPCAESPSGNSPFMRIAGLCLVKHPLRRIAGGNSPYPYLDILAR
jgi:hypothetical protein